MADDLSTGLLARFVVLLTRSVLTLRDPFEQEDQGVNRLKALQRLGIERVEVIDLESSNTDLLQELGKDERVAGGSREPIRQADEQGGRSGSD